MDVLNTTITLKRPNDTTIATFLPKKDRIIEIEIN